MTAGKINHLRTEIANMVRDEIQTVLKEVKAGVNPGFLRLRDKDREALTAWLMRYYFSPKKKDESWWSPRVNAQNVLAFISNPKNNFPLSPHEVLDDWNIKKSLKGDITKMKDDEIEAFEKNEPVYNTGDVTLKDIGQGMGGLTAAMINKLEQSGMEKFVKLMGGHNPMDMDEAELDDLLRKVDEARMATSLEFANDLRASKGNLKGFVQSLLKKQILTPNDVKLMNPPEIEMLMYLMGKPADQVAEYLRGDIRKDNNRIKSFQAAVARKLFPAGKRGRPRKNPAPTQE